MIKIRHFTRKLVTLICLVSLVLVFCTCKKDSTITISNEKQLTQTAYADETTTGNGFTFTATSDWVATVKESTTTKNSGVSWIMLLCNSVETYNGSAGTYTIRIYLDVNYTGKPRSASIEIVSGNDKIIISVTQQGTTKDGEVPESPSLTITSPSYGAVYHCGEWVNIFVSGYTGTDWQEFLEVEYACLVGEPQHTNNDEPNIYKNKAYPRAEAAYSFTFSPETPSVWAGRWVKLIAHNKKNNTWSAPQYIRIAPNENQVTFTISEATSISQNGATFNASVTSNITVTDKGICYSSTNNLPTTSNSKVSKGSGTGSFSATLTGLTENTSYYARPYAIANGTTYYGEVKTFTTLQGGGQVTFTISEASGISQNSATFNASITSNITITDKGICYSSTNNLPTTNDPKISKGSGAGNFSATLVSLTENTSYYARPYAIANGTTYYGEVKTFTTLQSENEIGIIINGIRWATRNVGAPYTFVSSPQDYGSFYNWDEAQNVCPVGWRTPSHEELLSLNNAGSQWTTINGVNGRVFGSGSNTIFLPAAGISGSLFGENGYYWSSSAYNSAFAYCLAFTQHIAFCMAEGDKGGRQCVRCVAE